jgi:hypothetical protein
MTPTAHRDLLCSNHNLKVAFCALAARSNSLFDNAASCQFTWIEQHEDAIQTLSFRLRRQNVLTPAWPVTRRRLPVEARPRDLFDLQEAKQPWVLSMPTRM